MCVGGLFVEDFFQLSYVQEVHCFESAFVEHGKVIEYAGQVLCFLQAVHVIENEGYVVSFAIGAYGCEALRNVGALCVVKDCEFLVSYFVFANRLSKVRFRAVEGEGKQFIAVIKAVDDFKAEFLGEGLVGQPCFLPFCSEHAQSAAAFLPDIVYCVFHEFFCVAFASERFIVNPQAIDIMIILSANRRPCFLQGCVLYEDCCLGIQLSEYMTFLQSLF